MAEEKNLQNAKVVTYICTKCDFIANIKPTDEICPNCGNNIWRTEIKLVPSKQNEDKEVK
jgi:rubrerythrin